MAKQDGDNDLIVAAVMTVAGTVFIEAALISQSGWWHILWTPLVAGVLFFVSILIVEWFKDEHKERIAKVQAHIAASEEPRTPSTAPDERSLPDELTKLVALRDAGALTPEEFDAAKRKLID